MTLLKALNKLKKNYKFKLILIGRGKEYKNIKDYIKVKNLSKIVKVFYTSNPFPYMKKAELFVLTSKFEGLPNVLLESTVLKNFIISSDCPTGPKEILLNGKGGLLFEVGNHEELEKKIIFYIQNKKKCSKMKDLSFKELVRFDYKKNLNKYFNLIKNNI